MLQDQAERTCDRCNEVKPTDRFARLHSGSHRRRTTCKSCVRAETNRTRHDPDFQQNHGYPPDTEAEHWCKECQSFRPKEEFSPERKTKNDGRQLKRTCNPCRGRIRRERYHTTMWDEVDGRNRYPADTATERWCSGCEAYKPFEQFQKYGRRSVHAGYRFRKCKSCSNAKRREYPNPWNSKILTEDEYQDQLQVQNGLCYLCYREQTHMSKWGTIKRLAIDHDHEHCKPGCPECFRKLLCDGCNTGLGNFQDNPELLRKAADYIEEHRRAREA